MATDKKTPPTVGKTAKPDRTGAKRPFQGDPQTLPRPEIEAPAPHGRENPKTDHSIDSRSNKRATSRKSPENTPPNPIKKSASNPNTRTIAFTVSGPFLSTWRAIILSCTTIWAFAEKIDALIWHHIMRPVRMVARWSTIITDWIFDALILFIKWLPTRSGQGYCAFFGVISLVTGLWITDELRDASLTLKAAQAGPGINTPLDADDPVMARIGGVYVHLSEVEAAARSAGNLQQGERLAVNTAFTRELVATFVDQRLLAEAAEKNGLDNATMLRARLRAARDRILAATQIDHILAEEVTDERVRALYEAQSDLTSLGEEIRIRHILVQSRAEAVNIINSIENGADFSTIARGRSLDRGTAPHGGDTGYITRDMVSNEFGRIAFAIDEGKISPPFRTVDGWNVINVLEKRESEGIAFAAVEDNLRRFLTLRAIDQILTTLKQDFDVVIFDHGTHAETSTKNKSEDG